MHIEQIKETFEIDSGAPMPTILSNEHELYLIFYVRQDLRNGDSDSVQVQSPGNDGIVTIKFERFAQYKFGNPNDEAIHGHPYYQLGLQAYLVQKVIGSDWINELIKMNAVHPYHKDEHFSQYVHYIFFFHDTCFEIVAEGYTIEQDSCLNMRDEIMRIAKMV